MVTEETNINCATIIFKQLDDAVKIAHLVEARGAASASGPTRRGATATAGTAQTNAPTPGRSGQTATGPPGQQPLILDTA